MFDPDAVDAQNAAAAERNRERGLPALTGTAKQRGWAESIRDRAVTIGRCPVERWEVDEAGWWIDHRDRLTAPLTAEEKRALEKARGQLDMFEGVAE